MDSFDEVWERIRSITGWRKYGEMAEFLGITAQTVSGAKGRGTFPLEWAFKIAQFYKSSTDWILTNEKPGEERREVDAHAIGEPAADHYKYMSKSDLAGEYVLVPRYNVKASMGGGSLVESEQVVDHLAFKSEWIRATMHMNPSDLLLISAMGDSMYPSIRQGDLLLVDKSQLQVRDDAIYVLQLNDALVAKRLQKLFDGSIQIKSDNKVYDAQLVPFDKVEMLKIIGRVVWVGGRV